MPGKNIANAGLMAEETRDVMIYTLDSEDFSIYRRHGREVVPFISPASA